MSTCFPYTYLIGWSEMDRWYFGVRYASVCHSSDLWVTYFTSSRHVNDFRNLHGDPDIIQIRKTFTNAGEAREWEQKVLRRLKVSTNLKWLNQTHNKGIDPHSASNAGRGRVYVTSPSGKTVKRVELALAARLILKGWTKGRGGNFNSKKQTRCMKPVIANGIKYPSAGEYERLHGLSNGAAYHRIRSSNFDICYA